MDRTQGNYSLKMRGSMNIKEIENYIKENPLEGFDICSQCGVTQESNTMQDINEVDFDIFCDDCYKACGVDNIRIPNLESGGA